MRNVFYIDKKNFYDTQNKVLKNLSCHFLDSDLNEFCFYIRHKNFTEKKFIKIFKGKNEKQKSYILFF